MSIFERIGEFGTIRALGNRSSQVIQLIMTKSLLLGLIGSVLGFGFCMLCAFIISAVGIPMPPPPSANLGYIAQIEIVPSALLMSCVIAFAATVLAAVLPARHVSRTGVVGALRQNY